MPNLVNTLVSLEYEREFSTADSMLFVSFGGLTVQETLVLRGELAAQGVKFRMVRNSLFKRALGERSGEFPDETFIGNTAIAYGQAEDTILAAKVFTTREVRKAGKVKLKAGLLEGRVLDAAASVALADIPDRDTLHAQLLGCISGPARGIATILNAVPSSVARVIQAHADREGDESAE